MVARNRLKSAQDCAGLQGTPYQQFQRIAYVHPSFHVVIYISRYPSLVYLYNTLYTWRCVVSIVLWASGAVFDLEIRWCRDWQLYANHNYCNKHKGKHISFFSVHEGHCKTNTYEIQCRDHRFKTTWRRMLTLEAERRARTPIHKVSGNTRRTRLNL